MTWENISKLSLPVINQNVNTSPLWLICLNCWTVIIHYPHKCKFVIYNLQICFVQKKISFINVNQILGLTPEQNKDIFKDLQNEDSFRAWGPSTKWMLNMPNEK